MPALPRPLLAALCLLALPASAGAGTVDSAECRRDLIVLESDLSQAQAALVKAQDATRTEQCTVWREQIATFRKASATYRRCKTGTDRRVLSAQMDSQALDFQNAIDQTCKGR